MPSNSTPILFACTQPTGLINSSPAVVGELARRGVPDLYFASNDNRRTEIEKLSACQPKHRRHGVNVQVVTDPAGRLL